VTKKTGCEILKILIKAVMPHRQKVLTQDGQEMRLQQWANKQAASALRDAGNGYRGEQFTQSRDMLMRDAVENPEKHGLKFMGERLPFEGQNLQESLSDPMDSPEFKEDMTEDESFSLAEKLDEKNRTPDLFDSEGKLRDGMPPEEEFNPDAEAEHMRRIMNSRDVPMRDAWSILKQGPYDREGRYLEHQDINICPEAKAYLQQELTGGPQFRDKDPNFCNNCDFCYGK
jgi:hypothetical protein